MFIKAELILTLSLYSNIFLLKEKYHKKLQKCVLVSIFIKYLNFSKVDRVLDGYFFVNN